ncbi:protein of unknown function [Burkholderia multivorans]
MSKSFSDVRVSMSQELKDEFISALAEHGVGFCDFIRAAAIHVIEKREIPFDVDMRLVGHRDALAAKREIESGHPIRPRIGRLPRATVTA